MGRGVGLVATMAAIVLGMLVSSAKGNYDAQSNSLIEMSGDIMLLDRILANYGPETKSSRDALRKVTVSVRDEVQSKGSSQLATPIPEAELFYHQIQQLAPKNDAQRALQLQALNTAIGIGRTRWSLYEQTTRSVPLPLLAVLVLWLTIIFISFGMFAPSNPTAVFTLAISALSVSGAVFLILEMYRLQGLIRVSTAPLEAAIAGLSQ